MALFMSGRSLSAFAGLLVMCMAGTSLTHAAQAAAVPVYEFPRFGLDMSADEVRAWAREHEFTRTAGTEPGQEAWRRVFPNGYNQLLQFIPAQHGLEQLILTQNNVSGRPSRARS